MRVLVACGAAGGIAATFNAPLAGVFFAMELILADFVAESFGMVVLAAVTASAIGRAPLGNAPFLHLPTFTVQHPPQYLLLRRPGPARRLRGRRLHRVLYADRGRSATPVARPRVAAPRGRRAAARRRAAGAAADVRRRLPGPGQRRLRPLRAWRSCSCCWSGKMLATSLTIGIGGSGGVFAPSLFIGAMLGSAFGARRPRHLAPVAGPAGAYGLVGMGAVFAGAARAPITAVVIMFELTGEYSIILPLMTAIVLATGISHRLTRDTIYTLKLRRRGVDLGVRETIDRGRVPISQVMQPVPPALSAQLPLAEAADRLARSAYGVLPVTDDGIYLGVLTARAVAETMADGQHDSTPAQLLVELPGAAPREPTMSMTASRRSSSAAVAPYRSWERRRRCRRLVRLPRCPRRTRPGARDVSAHAPACLSAM